MRIVSSIFFVLPTVILFSCSKKDSIDNSLFVLADSAFVIKNIKQTDLNEFKIEYYFNVSNVDNINALGIAVKNLTDSLDKTWIPVYGQPQTIIKGYYQLVGLRGDTRYNIKLYAVRNRDTIYSTTREILSQNLKIVDYGNPLKYFRPASHMGVVTNLPDTNFGLHSRFWIGNRECVVHEEVGSVLVFSIPDDIPFGYNSFTIKRKGLEAKYDSVYFYFGKWYDIGEFPVPQGAVVNRPNFIIGYGLFQRNQKGYLFGGILFDYLFDNTGQAYSSLDYFFEYNPILNTWTQIPYSVPTYFKWPVVETIDGIPYIVAGLLDTTNTNGSQIPIQNVYQFDFANRLWIKKGPIPSGLKDYNISFSHNGKIYKGLGQSSTFFGGVYSAKEFWEYDPTTDSWTRKADFPGRQRKDAGTFVIGNKAYVLGGNLQDPNYTSFTYTNELWEYNFTTDSWRQINYSGIGPDPFSKPVTFTYNGKGYILSCWERHLAAGGYDYTYDANWEFDPLTETFKEIVVPLSNVGGGVIYNIGNTFIFTGDEMPGVHQSMAKTVSKLKLE